MRGQRRLYRVRGHGRNVGGARDQGLKGTDPARGRQMADLNARPDINKSAAAARLNKGGDPNGTETRQTGSEKIETED
jgi:hypothetical protein